MRLVTWRSYVRLVFDIETNGLEPDTVWCIVAKDIDQGKVYSYDQWDIGLGIQLLSKASVLIGHNIIDYDIPVLERLYGFRLRDNVEVIDTLVLSRAIKPDRFQPGYRGKNNHSVEAWGCKFGLHKLEHEDWSQFSEEMLERCKGDVEIQHKIYDHLKEEMISLEFPEFSMKLETVVAQVINQQEVTGVPFNLELANRLLDYIVYIRDTMKGEVKYALGYALDSKSSDKEIRKRKVLRPFKDGIPSKVLLKLWGDKDLDIIEGPFTFIELNLDSTKEVIHKLYQLGWEPDPEEWNTKKDDQGKIVKTNPKLTNKGEPLESLMKMDNTIGQVLSKWYTIRHRYGLLKGLIGKVRSDGRIAAGANSCGTNTGRMRHRVVVNIPKANRDKEGNLIFDYRKQSDILGTQFRSLFCTLPGYAMVGYDASGLEFRMLAHYLNDPKLTQEILEGDIHTVIWDTCRDFVSSRSQMKNITYGLIYGAQDSKLGTMSDIKYKGWKDTKIGKQVRENIMKGLPSLKILIERVSRETKSKGYIIGIDGRRLFTRSQHSALNVLLQGGGAIVMKVSIALMYKWTKDLDTEKVIDMHDEAVYIAEPSIADTVGQLGVKSIVQAGKHFKLKCPLDGEYKIGRNWADVH